MNTYILTCDAWLYGKYYTQGSTIRLYPRQAKYELLSGTIVAHGAG